MPQGFMATSEASTRRISPVICNEFTTKLRGKRTRYYFLFSVCRETGCQFAQITARNS